MNYKLWGKARPIADQIKIGSLAARGLTGHNWGFASDLRLYQDNESIFKARQLARHMRKKDGDELVNFVITSNKAMESTE